MFIIKKYFIVLFTFLVVLKIQAQLGFCTGNSGEPIFHETFGEGSGFGDFPIGSSSSYRHINKQPENGFCTISSSSYGWFKWFNIPDHTANDTNGRMLIVNADRAPGEFFRISVSGLCENTSYEFSSWLINLLPASYTDCGYGKGPRPINVSFEICDSTNTTKLKSGNTGNIYSSAKPNWEQYALLFQTRSGQTSVILKIRNNGVGGCGNDLALDDIIFKPCGDTVVIKDTTGSQSISVSKDDLPFSTTLSAKPDFSVFSTHFYQWQRSTDSDNWEDIEGEINEIYTIQPTNIPAFYRVRVAEARVNLLNPSCNSNSEAFEIKIVEPKKPKVKKVKPIVKKPPVKKKVKAIPKKEPVKIEKPPVEVKPLVKEEPPKIVEIIDKQKLAKTHKKVIIVKNGFEIINDKIWVDGAIGRFVQTSEETIKQGNPNGIIIIDETIYYKSTYGYNSKTRRYRIE